MKYKHTQIGYLIVFVSFGVLLLFGAISTQVGFPMPAIIIMVFVLFLLFSFSTLSVTVDEKHLNIKFGYGLFQKQFLLMEIASVSAVRNHWYYGWGIRLWLWPKMWIYNVSGLDAVELVTKNGRRHRIGTDEPRELERALLQSIK